MPSAESRRVELNGRELHYRLRRSARRSIGLRIDDDGLLLTVPLRAGEADIAAALHARGDWIFRHLDRRALRPPPQPLADGSELLFLGQPQRLLVQPATGRRASVDHLPGELSVRLPESASLERTLELWYRRQALDHFASRIPVFARGLGLSVPTLSLTSARTRWGSCNHKGEIRLHWRLIQAAPALIDYVIAHELAHVLELNHSPRFWAQVERVYPRWREARAELQARGADLWAW